MNTLNQKTEIALNKPFTREINTTSFFQSPKQKYKIPKLPLLEDMVNLIKKNGALPDLSHTIFVGVQHMLETTVTLFDALIALGVQPQNMYFSGKCYSTSPVIKEAVLERGIHFMPGKQPKKLGEYESACQAGISDMWEYCLKDIKSKLVDRIIILDEGGRCLEDMPSEVPLSYPTAAIEQTRAGLYSEATHNLSFDLIDVATSAAKKYLEPPLIAMAVVNGMKGVLSKLSLNRAVTFGVIGNGMIGNAVCRYLISLGYNVCAFDPQETAFQGIDSRHFFRLESISRVITATDVVIGCTGKDITADIDIPALVKKNKIFISCTSEDKEFRSLLKYIAAHNISFFDSLGDITCQTKNGREILIVAGGFPVNFNRKPWNVPAEKIEVTQGLLLGSCIQAIYCAKKLVDDGFTMNCSSRQALNSSIQRYVALHWLSRQEKGAYPPDYLELFNDSNWIQKNSGGQSYQDDQLVCFGLPPQLTTTPVRAKL